MGQRIKLKIRDGGMRARTRDEVAEKTQVAVYTGAHFVAERDGEDLIIYSIGTDGGAGVVQRNSTADQIAPRRQITSDIRGADKRAKDALKTIRDTQSTMAGMNKAASDLWGLQRAAQDAAFK